ncbi:probable cytochrome P450 12d1 proximal, mitochondrial [Saccostrea echinata]|uniref:probable cytochrome P450 12d1 proximal, mitochondrial n=1 Tax=Saccostrea echinata TaxID=191078 RepID=UPI002A8330E4|nr:probable cytochrome P450 12d1 proximal, mitochondrial [Saccostrea echinata]
MRSDGGCVVQENPSFGETFNKIPGPRGIYSFPFLGTALHFKPFTDQRFGNINDLLRVLQRKYGDIYRFRGAFRWIVVISSPNLAKEVLSVRVKYPYRPEVEIVKVFGIRNNKEEGLGTLQGEAWWNLRKPAQDQMLKPSAVRSHIPLIGQVADDFVASLKDTLVIEDCLDTLVSVATECMGMLCFNRRLGCLEGQPVVRMEDLNTIFTSTSEAGKFFKPYKYFKSPFYKRFEEAVLKLHSITEKEIETAMQRLRERSTVDLQGQSSEPNLLLSMLSDSRLNKDKINILITNLFGGGIDSTSNSLVLLWHEIAVHSDKQEKIYLEIMAKIGHENLNTETLSKLPYLKACLRESMRKNFPINVGSIRIFDNDCCVAGYHIPKKTPILIASNNISKDTRFYKHPHQYIPERFLRRDKTQSTLDEEVKHTHPFAFLPFGFGPRSCIGQRFAETEMLVLTIKLIQNFRISLPPGSSEHLETVTRTFTAPARKVTLHLTPRQKS